MRPKSIVQSLIYGTTGRLLVDPSRFDIIAKRITEPEPEPPPPSAVKFDGEHSRTWWATRDDHGESTAPGYWAQRTFPARRALADAVAALDGSSLLEVGCHAGANLWAADQVKRWSKMAGTELSSTVLTFARQNLPTSLICPVEIVQARADDLPFPDDSFDVILTSNLLSCIGPLDIEKSLAELCRVSKRWLVLGEAIELDRRYATPEGREDPYPNTMYWIRSYDGLLKGRAERRNVITLPAEWHIGHLNSISIFELTG